jgi:hypothetical protein
MKAKPMTNYRGNVMTNSDIKLSCAAMLVGLSALVQVSSTAPASAQAACCFAGNDNCCDNVGDAAKQSLSIEDRNKLETRLTQIHKQKNPSTTPQNQTTTTPGK